MTPTGMLRAIKLAHTLIWAFFAGCILAIPVFTHAGRLRIAGALIAVVLVEVLVIVFNRGSCPLTGLAARYTSDRRDNFDIYLPLWLAKYNKTIFGALFLAAVAHALFTWMRSGAAG